MKVKVETNMTHDTMKVDLGNRMSGFQKVKVEYEELETDVVEEANQTGRMGQSLCVKQGIKAKKEPKDGNDTLRVNRALISKKSNATGISGLVSFEHKCCLRRLLKKMMREHKWKGAAGVLSTLLKGTCKDYLSLKNRRKYWASLELLRRIGFSSGNLWKLEHMYEIWLSKQRTGNRTLRMKKYLIQLEHALLLLMEAKVEDACYITKFLVQEPESRNDSIIHLVHGLILYQLWYAGIPENLQLRTRGRHEAAAFSSSDLFSIHHSKSKPVEAPDSDNAIDNLKMCASGYNSESSIDNCKKACVAINDKSSIRKQVRRPHPCKLYMDPTAEIGVEDSLCTDDSYAADFSVSYAWNYVMEKLIEMIALHLDATCGTSYVWQHLAMLLLKVQMKQFQYEDDRISTEHAYEGNTSLPSFTNTILLPKIFSGKEQKKVWKLRCRWWYTRHFSSKINLNENGTGDLQLLTFKAACAAHFYGRSFEYVTDVYSVLEQQDDGHIAILKKHIDSCLDLQNKLNKKRERCMPT